MNTLCVVQTFVIGTLGAGLAYLLYIPAPFLLGPATAVTIAALAGLSMSIPAALRQAGFILIGLGMGSSVTPEVVGAAARWPISIAILLSAVAAILWGGGMVLRRTLGLSRETAVLAAAPGHLSYVLSLGLETKADLPLLTLIQSLRVLALTILTPPLVLLIVGETLPRGLALSEPMSLLALAGMAAVAFVAGVVFERFRVPAGMLMAAMLVSAIGHGAGIVSGSVPPWAAIPGFILMGSLIGTRFSGVSLRMLLRALGGATILVGLAVVTTSLAAFAAAHLFGFPLAPALIAFAPGGVETMAAMALLLHADPAYVALHHVVRIFSLTFLIPLALGPKRG